MNAAMRRLHAFIPFAAAAMLVPAFGLDLQGTAGSAFAALSGAALIAAVFMAVHHAEVVAHRVGEPFGTLLLAVAVTVIEAALIVSMMLSGGAQAAALPRDAVFAAVMIIATGVVGLCMVVGGLRHHKPEFRIDGVNAGLAALIAISVLVLVLPAFTTSTPGPTYTPSQLIFAAVASLVIWLLFVFVQTVRHRDDFLPPDNAGDAEAPHGAPMPSLREAWWSAGLLMVALVAVVGLAKSLSPWIESAVATAGAPKAVIGIAIALLVLLPETLAAVRAAHANKLQTSLNLAFGSALACIGLTVPVVVIASFVLGLPLELGLDSKSMVLLATTFIVSAVTLAPGRTNVMEGGVHLVLFAAYLFLSFVP